MWRSKRLNPRDELVSRLDEMIAGLKEAPRGPSAGDEPLWTYELADTYASEFSAFRERILSGSTTEQDRTMSWARALDFEGVGYGDLSHLAAKIDASRSRFFAAE